MASLCCGNRLSLRNQYDTKTPRASLSLLVALGGLGLLAACLDLRSRLTRVTNPMHTVRFDILRNFQKSREKKISRKNSFGAPGRRTLSSELQAESLST
jgi:hypothetical protein